MFENLDLESLKSFLTRELPHLMEKSPEIREAVLNIARDYFAEKKTTEDRFEKLLAEIRAMREESERRWKENQKRWEENEKRWEENQKRWEENEKRWEENQKRWEENNRHLHQLYEEIKALREKQERDVKRIYKKIESSLGALGARWGIKAEHTFRKAIKEILEEDFPVKVERLLLKDSEGKVFGYPETIELDLIIKDSKIILGEIKSSMSLSDMIMFKKKADFFVEKTGKKPHKLIVISPMVEDKAKEYAKKHKIRVFTSPELAKI